MMKTWKIPVSWELSGIQEVEAETLEEAIKKFDSDNDDYGLPEGDYVDGSYRRDDFDVCRALNT